MTPVPMPALHVKAWEGLGDNIYLRPFVRVLASRRKLYLETVWPELYDDLPVRFLRPEVHYRTQAKNVARQPESRWAELPPRPERLRPRISMRPSIADALAGRLRVRPAELVWDLPDFGPSPIEADRPIAVIRPATVRQEWANPARNPRPDYLALAGELLQERGFYVVSIADLQEGEEWIVEPAPPADLEFHQGELEVRELVSLVRHAAVAVGGVGFLLPMAVCTGTPLVMIGGGNGALNHPDRVTSASMDLARLRWLLPERYCFCANLAHDCPKEIPDFPARLTAALESVT